MSVTFTNAVHAEKIVHKINENVTLEISMMSSDKIQIGMLNVSYSNGKLRISGSKPGVKLEDDTGVQLKLIFNKYMN